MANSKSCEDLLKNLDKDILKITTEINNFYKENKYKENITSLLNEEFSAVIFKFKNQPYIVGILNEKTEVLSLDPDCSQRLKDKINSIDNRIQNIIR